MFQLLYLNKKYLSAAQEVNLQTKEVWLILGCSFANFCLLKYDV